MFVYAHPKIVFTILVAQASAENASAGRSNMRNDTIAAIATGLSEAGVSIIRISGKKAFSIADAIFLPKKQGKIISQQKSHTIHYGYIVIPSPLRHG